jgi:hypothetical protein
LRAPKLKVRSPGSSRGGARGVVPRGPQQSTSPRAPVGFTRAQVASPPRCCGGIGGRGRLEAGAHRRGLGVSEPVEGLLRELKHAICEAGRPEGPV